MDNVLLTAGAACLIGALVGGGLKAFGIELPLVQSRMRQAGLAVVGIIFIVLAGPSLPSLPGRTAPAPTQLAAAARPPNFESTAAPAATSAAPVPGSRATVSSAARVTLSGSDVAVKTTGPGQHMRLGFDGQSHQAVSILVRDASSQQSTDTSPGCSGAHLQLLAPGEQALAAVRGCTPILARQLPVDGSYAIDVSTDYEGAAEFKVRLFDASPQSGQISPGGSPVPIRTTAPGQHVRLTFAGLVDQVVTVTVRDPSLQSPADTSLGCDGAHLDLLSPVGQSLGGMARCSPLSSKRLSADGTYTVDFSTDQELPSDFVIQLFAL